MLHLAASLADRAPVSLGEAVTGIDPLHNLDLLVTAIRHARGQPTSRRAHPDLPCPASRPHSKDIPCSSTH